MEELSQVGGILLVSLNPYLERILVAEILLKDLKHVGNINLLHVVGSDVAFREVMKSMTEASTTPISTNWIARLERTGPETCLTNEST